MRSRSKGPAPGEEDGADGEAKAPELRLLMSGSLQNGHKVHLCFPGMHSTWPASISSPETLNSTGWLGADAALPDHETKAC